MSNRDHVAQSRRGAGNRKTDAAARSAGVNIHNFAEPCTVDRVDAADIQDEGCGRAIEKRASGRCKGD